MPEADDEDPDAFDKYIGAQVLLNHGGQVLQAKVTGRKRDADGKPIGRWSQNPLLDTREYNVEFVDGSMESFATNVIAEAMYSQVDEHGRNFAILKEITDHRKNGHAVSKDDGWFTTRNGRKCRRRTTKGWDHYCTWKDGSGDWISLKDLKESHPIQVAEYAVANKLVEEPAYAW